MNSKDWSSLLKNENGTLGTISIKCRYLQYFDSFPRYFRQKCTPSRQLYQNLVQNMLFLNLGLIAECDELIKYPLWKQRQSYSLQHLHASTQYSHFISLLRTLKNTSLLANQNSDLILVFYIKIEGEKDWSEDWSSLFGPEKE